LTFEPESVGAWLKWNLTKWQFHGILLGSGGRATTYSGTATINLREMSGEAGLLATSLTNDSDNGSADATWLPLRKYKTNGFGVVFRQQWTGATQEKA
jgi:hypothetical protein